MNYLILKSLHLIAVVTWFAGLFYMPRLFVYFAEAAEKNEVEKNILQAQFKIMQRRLWYGITWPSAIAVMIFGTSMLSAFWPISDHPWLIVKLTFVVGLYLYHFFLHTVFKRQQAGDIAYSPMSFRIINEISTIFLVAIVSLVILKNVISMFYGLLGLLLLIIILMMAIKIYQRIRNNSQ